MSTSPPATEDGDQQVFFDAVEAEPATTRAMAEPKGQAAGGGVNGAGLEDGTCAGDGASARNAPRPSPASVGDHRTATRPRPRSCSRSRPPAASRTRRASVMLPHTEPQVPSIPQKWLDARDHAGGTRKAPLRVDISSSSGGSAQRRRDFAPPDTRRQQQSEPAPAAAPPPAPAAHTATTTTTTTTAAAAAGGKTPVPPVPAIPTAHSRRFQLPAPAQSPGGPANYELTSTPGTKSCPASPKMASVAPKHLDQTDFFMELGREGEQPTTQRSFSRASAHIKRRSMPGDMASERRPSTSGNIYARPSSRLGTIQSDTGIARYSSTRRASNARAATQIEDHASIVPLSQYGRARRFSALRDRPPSRIIERVMSPDSPASPPFGRQRNTSFDTALSQQSDHKRECNQAADTYTAHPQHYSPPESPDPHRTDSSAASQASDTVWDELNALKTRLNNLESGGKATPRSSGAASGESSERPRTATTAPTTIDYSPKQTRKPELDSHAKPSAVTTSEIPDNGSTAASVHPLLQTALGTAKDTLPSSVYRTLEAVVAEATQLAAMTSGAGTQAASTQNRQVRRKADNICRALTDHCIALADSTKQDVSAIVSSPAPRLNSTTSISTSTSARSASWYSLTNTRSTSLTMNVTQAARPQSRLEARRSSLLASLPRGELESISPRGTFGADRSVVGDHSTSEVDSTPTHPSRMTSRRISAAPQGVLRSRVKEDETAEEGRPFRPQSRAFTEIARAKSRLLSEERSPSVQRRNLSLRDSLASRKRYENTPPVLEEEATTETKQRQPSRSWLRGPVAADAPARRASLNQHHHRAGPAE